MYLSGRKELADFLRLIHFKDQNGQVSMLKDAYGEVLDYIKNINTLGASYDLAKHTRSNVPC